MGVRWGEREQKLKVKNDSQQPGCITAELKEGIKDSMGVFKRVKCYV